ncbi:DEAD/DEAH box helicase family protein [Candidatus Nomurabacteria bacterium]|nr:DEAD/DEAH box helicase family protein [Candidatus Nomurabacteria bacterium]
MENSFLENIKIKVSEWRENSYQGGFRESINILNYVKRIGFLHEPQIEALETYIYIKEILNNKPTGEIFQNTFTKKSDLLRSLGVLERQISDIMEADNRDKQIAEIIKEKFGAQDYANQVYALTMGSGKTILMATFLIYDFVLSYYHPSDIRFAKNALVFAPDTTIIESLKEIKTFDYSKVLPKEYQNILLNIKYHYLESTETGLSPIGNYNVIVSNSQKIILKTRNSDTDGGVKRLFGDKNELAKREVENARLRAIRELNNLVIFVDEAHHSYGVNLEGALKKTRQTIDYLHGNTPLVGVVNLTGTPYINNRMIDDVVYHFGLKQGIEKGILKQVKILDFGEVRSNVFIEEVLSTFWSEYGENRLEGRLPKMAFYAPNIENLRNELKPRLERVLAEMNIPIDKVLEYHTEAEDSKDEFRILDTIESKKQFVLLVGKGTEGWNCRSLVACALYRKPSSSIFVLQASTRCMRSIGDNSTRAHIFLSKENYKVLDKELKNNFASSIQDINNQEQASFEFEIKVEKKKTIKVKKLIRDIIATQATDTNDIKIDIKKYKPEKYEHYILGSELVVDASGKAILKHDTIGSRKIKDSNSYTYYEIVELINRYTHLPCLAVGKLSENIGLSRSELVDKVNTSVGFLPFIIQTVLETVYQYTETETTTEEEIELTKEYPFKMSREEGKKALVVYKDKEEESGGLSRIGFHINPYNFDSSDERDLFKNMRQLLNNNETIKDVYFTGGITTDAHNDFYVEYWNPAEQRISKYFPDFLIETDRGRFLVVEVKSGSEKTEYEANKKRYDGTNTSLFNEVYAKELGFLDFQKVNKDFEYKVIFDAHLQERQRELFETIKTL